LSITSSLLISIEKNMMKDFKVFYDGEEGIVYLRKEGKEDTIELSLSVNIELNESGSLIGIEKFRVSKLLKEVIKPLQKRLRTS
jgi:uncharacterized protein YuzE